MKPHSSFVVAALLTAACTLPPLSSQATDWPNWRGPNHDGITTESLPDQLAEELPVLWETQVGIGFSTVSVEGNRVLTMGNQDEVDTVWCLSAETGDVIWKHSYDCELDPLYYEGGPSATPTIHEGSVYTLSKKGHVFRLDLETGDVVWSRDLIKDHGFELPEWSFASSPYIHEDQVLLNVGRQGMALSLETGETLWAPSTETSGYATVVPFSEEGSKVDHLLFSAKGLIGFRASDGESVWELPWRSSRDVNAADPLVLEDGIVLSSSAGTVKLQPLSADEAPQEKWRQHDLKWYFNPGVRIGDHLYSLHGTTHRPTELTCTNLQTGETVWAEEGFGSGGLMATADGEVIVFDNGMLTIFEASPEGFEPIVQQMILEGKCWTAPVLANGQIYCRTAEGSLAAVGVR